MRCVVRGVPRLMMTMTCEEHWRMVHAKVAMTLERRRGYEAMSKPWTAERRRRRV